MSSERPTSAPDVIDPTQLSIIVTAVSGFVLLVLIAVTCICYRRWKSKNSANVRTPRTAHHPTKQNHYAYPPVEPESTTRGHVKKASASQMTDDHQHPNDLENVGGIYVTVQPSTSSTGQTGSSTGGAATDHRAVDALYSKVKKSKRTRAANDLYSKPDKKGKGHATNGRSGVPHGGNTDGDKEDLYTRSSKQKRGKSKSESETVDELYTKSSKQKRGRNKSENESETADELYTKSTKQKRGRNKSENEKSETADELYTKSAKQKRGRGKGEKEKSETDDELYTKPSKKGKKLKQADYANYNLVKDLNSAGLDVCASGDVTQGANCQNGIIDNELYTN